jgi:hypothetical protein
MIISIHRIYNKMATLGPITQDEYNAMLEKCREWGATHNELAALNHHYRELLEQYNIDRKIDKEIADIEELVQACLAVTMDSRSMGGGGGGSGGDDVLVSEWLAPEKIVLLNKIITDYSSLDSIESSTVLNKENLTHITMLTRKALYDSKTKKQQRQRNGYAKEVEMKLRNISFNVEHRHDTRALAHEVDKLEELFKRVGGAKTRRFKSRRYKRTNRRKSRRRRYLR